MKRILIVGDRASGHNENYYEAVEAVHCIPVPCDFFAISASVRSSDAVLLPGGADINPLLYGQENTASVEIDDALDAIEKSVLREAVALKRPVLGICRGLQMINVFFGGTLIQDLPFAYQHKRINEHDSAHSTSVLQNSFVYECYGEPTLFVNSAHHQGIDRLGEGLCAVQFCADGTIEAIEHTALPIFGVQWHPERMCLKNARSDTANGLAIFEHFAQSL